VYCPRLSAKLNIEFGGKNDSKLLTRLQVILWPVTFTGAGIKQGQDAVIFNILCLILYIFRAVVYFFFCRFINHQVLQNYFCPCNMFRLPSFSHHQGPHFFFRQAVYGKSVNGNFLFVSVCPL
jgi:hypothetical protein